MSDPFAERPLDEDTKVSATRRLTHEDLDILVEEWSWDGVSGKSAIVPEAQVKDLDDAGLLARISEAVGIKTSSTISRNRSGFAFINYDFRS